MAAVVNINEVLDGHIALDLDCLDRIYLNAYVPNLQVGGQVVVFLTQHLGNPVPSPALFTKIGNAFRAAVERFAATHDIPVVMISADATPGQVERLRGEGAQEYLTKPLDVRRLLEVLRENLPAAQAVSRGGP